MVFIKTTHPYRTTSEHSKAQHSTAQHNTAQRNTAQRSTAQHNTTQHNAKQNTTAKAPAPEKSPRSLLLRGYLGTAVALQTSVADLCISVVTFWFWLTPRAQSSTQRAVSAPPVRQPGLHPERDQSSNCKAARASPRGRPEVYPDGNLGYTPIWKI